MTKFIALENRAGKITATAQKQAGVLNSLTPKALLGAALDGRGAIAKRAKGAVRREAITLDVLDVAFASNAPMDGGLWGDVRGLLAAAYGVAAIKKAELVKQEDGTLALVKESAKDASVRILSVAVRKLETALLLAETDKQQESAMKRLALAQSRLNVVDTLIRRAYEAAKAAQDGAQDGQQDEEAQDETVSPA